MCFRIFWRACISKHLTLYICISKYPRIFKKVYVTNCDEVFALLPPDCGCDFGVFFFALSRVIAVVKI